MTTQRVVILAGGLWLALYLFRKQGGPEA